ncbi:uncharacterized protein N7506_000489 [Penicillium brevicompactum]|uniref:uncharacterized protein n=1 Tax=Penicillium brevicompactum TaxID=5074 RepID=UPI0025408085|nr:uncharacterized protein N7506_000489 [Penicillium brevicompactum]KAJ5347236.1 hypothetical protein N7506_000489 [Penicillium brevicompactum]
MSDDADVKLVDHKKKNLPHDTFSYQYVERSIAKGRLEDLEAHRAGPSAHRPMGASNIPIKGKRSSFTQRDDQILYDWIYHFGKSPGAPIQGNKFYQDLAEYFPNHPWQSWRSRYTKHLALNANKRPGGGVPQSLEEIIQCAPAKDKHPKILPTRTSEPVPVVKTGANDLESAPASDKNTMGTPKRKRDSIPEPPKQIRVEVSPFKRRAIEASVAADSPSLPPHRETQRRHPHPQPSTMTTPPTRRAGSPKDSPSTSNSRSKPIEGLGIPELFPPQIRQEQASPPTREPHPPPKHVTKISEPLPRPPGDNAFARFARFKKQEAPPRPPPSDPYKDNFDPGFLELPFPPSSSPPEPTEDDVSETPDIDSWIDARLARGADESHIFDALRCTSMEMEMADRVLKHLSAGKGIPNNMPGVWTTEDDECFQAEEHSKVQRALSKHGAGAFKARWEYFRLAREGGINE